MKWFFIAAFIAIAASLAGAGFFLLKDTPDTARGKKRMAWALTARISLSVFLFLSIWGMYAAGWIKPTGLPYNPNAAVTEAPHRV